MEPVAETPAETATGAGISPDAVPAEAVPAEAAPAEAAPAEAAPAGAAPTWGQANLEKVIRKVTLRLVNVLGQLLQQVCVPAAYAVFKVDVRGAVPSDEGMHSYGTWAVQGPVFGEELELLKGRFTELAKRLVVPCPTALYLAVEIYDGDRPCYQAVPMSLGVVYPSQIQFEVPGDAKPESCDCPGCSAPPGAR